MNVHRTARQLNAYLVGGAPKRFNGRGGDGAAKLVVILNQDRRALP